MEQQKQWTIYKGRPLDEQGRSLAERRVYDLLDELGIDYERVDHEAAMTMAACRDIDRLLHVHACKNLFLRNTQKTRFYLLLIAGDKKFQDKRSLCTVGDCTFILCGGRIYGKIPGGSSRLCDSDGTDE